MRKTTPCLLIAALMLSACASGGMPIAAPEFQVPASLAHSGPETLPDPGSNQPDALLQNHVETTGQYHRLRERHQGLLQWLSTKRIIARELR